MNSAIKGKLEYVPLPAAMLPQNTLDHITPAQ